MPYTPISKLPFDTTKPIDIADLNATHLSDLQRADLGKYAKDGGGQAFTITPQQIPPAVYQLQSTLQNDFPNLQVPTDGTSSGATNSVDTGSLTAFADWIDNTLLPAIRDMAGQVEAIDVQPGGLPAAQTLKTNVMGGSEADGQTPGGLKAAHTTVLNNLNKGLTNLSTDMRGLAGKFANADALNKATTQDLQAVMNDLNGLVTGTGGTPSIPNLGNVGNIGSSSSTGSSNPTVGNSAGSSGGTGTMSGSTGSGSSASGASR